MRWPVLYIPAMASTLHPSLHHAMASTLHPSLPRAGSHVVCYFIVTVTADGQTAKRGIVAQAPVMHIKALVLACIILVPSWYLASGGPYY